MMKMGGLWSFNEPFRTESRLEWPQARNRDHPQHDTSRISEVKAPQTPFILKYETPSRTLREEEDRNPDYIWGSIFNPALHEI